MNWTGNKKIFVKQFNAIYSRVQIQVAREEDDRLDDDDTIDHAEFQAKVFNLSYGNGKDILRSGG